MVTITSGAINAIIADISKGVYAQADSIVVEYYNDDTVKVTAHVDDYLYLLGFEVVCTDIYGKEHALEQQQYEWLVFEVEQQLKQARAELQSEAQYIKSRAE